MSKQLIDLYQQMADLTLPKCRQCRAPLSCCDLFYCEIAAQFALEKYNIKLEHTNHPELPFMGENGCTVPPYLRPMCTLHTCNINSLGFDPKDPEWTEQYFSLRELIEQAEWEEEALIQHA